MLAFAGSASATAAANVKNVSQREKRVFADEGHGIVKFKGEVISAPCSIKPGDEDLTVNLGEVADTVLKSDQKSLAEPFTIHLQDCMLSQGGTTYSKAKVTFTTANTMTGQSDLLKNTKETEIGGATIRPR